MAAHSVKVGFGLSTRQAVSPSLVCGDRTDLQFGGTIWWETQPGSLALNFKLIKPSDEAS